MTPTEALAQALGDVVDIDPGTPVEGAYATAGSVHVNWNDALGAASLLALALDANGYTVARKDDAADGEALAQALRDLSGHHGGADCDTRNQWWPDACEKARVAAESAVSAHEAARAARGAIR